MKRIACLLSIATLATLALSPTVAEARSWKACSSSARTTEWTGHGVYLRTSSLRVRSPMNCASGRYALSRARRFFRRRAVLPRVFYDGYVVWFGKQIGGGRWNGTAQYSENTSNTRFRFRFKVWSD
jgi:hypothetical protein